MVAGFSLVPETIGSSVVVTEGPADGFIRGDVNFDARLDIADPSAHNKRRYKYIWRITSLHGDFERRRLPG